ncbi:MAG: HAD family hydrolase [Phycisphaerales bacterium]|nr:MAG: HAD family hydrolase [Phycisphaerales bacterium]
MSEPSPGPKRAAFFDVDGTLVRTTIVHYYAYFRLLNRPRWSAALWRAAFLCRCLGYLVLDKFDRSWFNVYFYRNYRGMCADEVRARAADCFETVMAPRLYADAARCVRDQAASGRMVVLVTGSIDFLIAPLAALLGVGQVIAPRLVERDGRFTGDLDGLPIGNGEKAARVKAFADAHGVDLEASFAYGDSIADLPMLECVGNPVAVNPDRALRAIAARRGWPVLRWTAVGDARGDARGDAP